MAQTVLVILRQLSPTETDLQHPPKVLRQEGPLMKHIGYQTLLKEPRQKLKSLRRYKQLLSTEKEPQASPCHYVCRIEVCRLVTVYSIRPKTCFMTTGSGGVTQIDMLGPQLSISYIRTWKISKPGIIQVVSQMGAPHRLENNIQDPGASLA